MIRAFNTDRVELLQVTPTQDVTGKVISASVFFGEKFVKTVNNVLPSLARTYATFNASNSSDQQQTVTMTVYGRMLNSTDWVVIDVFEIPVDIAETPLNYQREYDRGDYRDIQAGMTSVPAGVTVSGLSIIRSDASVKNGLVVGGAADEMIVIPCDFTGMTPSDEYSIVFEADDIGVIGRDRLVLFNEDGYSLQGDKEIVYFKRPGKDAPIEESLDIPEILEVALTSSSGTVFHSAVIGATGYQYRLVSVGDPVDTDGSNPFLIRNLQSLTPYGVQVRAYSTNRLSDWSEPFEFTTTAPSQQKPQSPPQNISITTGPSTAILSFEPVVGAEGYKYRINGGSEEDMDALIPYTIENLINNQTFNIELLAYNSAGESNWSPIENFSTTKVPPSEKVVITDDTMSTNSGSITYNNVARADWYEYRLGDSTPVNIGLIKPFTISNLLTLESYDLQMRGRNNGGPGPWSDVRVITTIDAQPTDKASITLITTGAPFTGQGQLTRTTVSGATGYKYRYDEGAAIEVTTENPFPIVGLPSNRYVDVQVLGFNSGGDGPWSDKFRILTPPFETASVSLVEATSTSLTLNVGTVSGDGNETYFVKIGDGSFVQVQPGEVTFPALNSGVTYNIETYVANAEGDGPVATTQESTLAALAEPVWNEASFINGLDFIEVHWTGGGPDYQLKMGENGTLINLTAGETSYRFDGLTPGFRGMPYLRSKDGSVVTAFITPSGQVQTDIFVPSEDPQATSQNNQFTTV